MADLTHRDVVVVGGANTDYLVRGKKLPRQGETVEGDVFQYAAGGRGVNQAVAAARMGARVAFVGRVGNDDRGDQIIRELDREGIDTTFISRTDRRPTGAALVMVDENGDKQIQIAPGANHDMTLEDVERAAGAIRSAKVLLTQLEIPVNVVEAALTIADENATKTILDPAPGQPLEHAFLRHVHIIRLNAGEGRVFTGVRSHNRSSARQAAGVLLERGVRSVIIQAGNQGHLVVERDGEWWIPYMPVQSLDVTGAGDAFAGALAAQLASDVDLLSASIFANGASILATTKVGAQANLPSYDEVRDYLKRIKPA